MQKLQPADIGELKEVLAHCNAARKSIEIGGHFTKRWMGGSVQPADMVVSTARLNHVIDYEPRDLTISVEAGVGFRNLQELLRENNEMLPLDPPLAEQSTVGGVVAASCSGPRRRLYGSARDMVIGMTFVTVEGRPVRSGGMVVKNVAGLDMAKLMIGSFGTLAAIASVNFKVFPRPPKEKTFVLAFQSLERALQARDAVLRSALQPSVIDLANPALCRRLGLKLGQGFWLLVEAGGIDAVLGRYERELKALARQLETAEFVSLEADEAESLWRSVRDFPALPPLNGSSETGPRETGAVVRISTPLARLDQAFAAAGDWPALARAGTGVTYVRCEESPAELTGRARAAGLYAVIESCSTGDKDNLELWADPGPELDLMSRIKNNLDPQSILNHGRLYNRL
ncbi:MAG TPA: FAD-binding oxidoreductase [Bryobacterales bacterium]|jgi:glycolate oxidase FAD binding subunit|nr:FAD-binding oxidoreductase [Bryobacterales bacterium]